MTLTEYQKLARRTGISPHSPGQYKTHDEFELMHLFYGLSTESGELNDIEKKLIFYKKDYDTINAIEELGDMLWYIANYFEYKNIGLENLYIKIQHEKYNVLKIQNYLGELSIAISDYIESNEDHKKEYYHGKIMGSILVITSMVESRIEILGYNLSDVLDINIKKLQVRYPDKFDYYLAENRNIEAEKKIINGLGSSITF